MRILWHSADSHWNNYNYKPWKWLALTLSYNISESQENNEMSQVVLYQLNLMTKKQKVNIIRIEDLFPGSIIFSLWFLECSSPRIAEPNLKLISAWNPSMKPVYMYLQYQSQIIQPPGSELKPHCSQQKTVRAPKWSKVPRHSSDLYPSKLVML